MVGFIFSKWRDEEHAPWWDDDPAVREQNLRVERSLRRHMNSVLNINGPDDEEPPDQRGGEMPPIIGAALKYGLTPVLLAWLLFLGVTEFRADLKASREDARSALRTVERHAAETMQRMDRYDLAQERIVNLLRAQCVNAAKNNSERNDCLRAGQ